MTQTGRRSPEEYIEITAEVFFDQEKREKRVRPLEGQGFPTSMLIECSKKIRQLPLGTRIKIRVVETRKEDSRKFLYSSYKWDYEIIK